jgi:hypothetical protein
VAVVWCGRTVYRKRGTARMLSSAGEADSVARSSGEDEDDD